jgi:hypothetical protein
MMPFDLKQENNDFKYARLNDTSLTASSLLIVDPFDDQKLPSTSSSSLVGKEGIILGGGGAAGVIEPIRTDLFLVQQTNELESKHHIGSRSVPDSNQDNSYTSTTSSLIYTNYNQQQQQQQHQIANIQPPLVNEYENDDEDDANITKDHIKYINLFSILCCWCFPITGLIGIFYSMLTRKYYKQRDLRKAKKYLRKAEWSLILTFLFG